MPPNNYSCGCAGQPDSEADLPSIISTINPDEKVTVKFKLDESHIIAQVYNGRWSVDEVLADLAGKFKVDTKYLELCHDELDERHLAGSIHLYKLPHNEFSIIEVGLRLNKLADEANEMAIRRSEVIILDPEVFYRLKLARIFCDAMLNKHKNTLLVTISCPYFFRFKYKMIRTRVSSPRN